MKSLAKLIKKIAATMDDQLFNDPEIICDKWILALTKEKGKGLKVHTKILPLEDLPMKEISQEEFKRLKDKYGYITDITYTFGEDEVYRNINIFTKDGNTILSSELAIDIETKSIDEIDHYKGDKFLINKDFKKRLEVK